jgi:hypothetical protein
LKSSAIAALACSSASQSPEKTNFLVVSMQKKKFGYAQKKKENMMSAFIYALKSK